MKPRNVGWLLSIALLLIFSSCKKEPVASFEFDQNNVKAPATINFTNTSINASEYLWNFGDGVTSNEVNPSHEYLKGGDFNVSLKAYGEDDTHTVEKTITILPNMTGHWNVIFVMQDYTFKANMNLVENENQTLSGEFALVEDQMGVGYTPILASSKIDGFSVTIDALFYGFINIGFKGTVNETYDSMSGNYSFDGTPAGAWSAKKN